MENSLWTHFFLRIGHCVEHPDQGRLRVTGFYAWQDGQVAPRLHCCFPAEDDFRLIAANNTTLHFFNPWELRFAGGPDWDAAKTKERRMTWHHRALKRDHKNITRQGYPELIARYGAMTNHQKLLFAQWKRKTAEAIRDGDPQ